MRLAWPNRRTVAVASLAVLVLGGTAAGVGLALAGGRTPNQHALHRIAGPFPTCPPNRQIPSNSSGVFCGPEPSRGNGFGANGECTGRETGPPCGSGVVAGRYYAYTLPGRCDGLIIFDARKWVSELPPQRLVADTYVWMALAGNGRPRFISPTGSVGFDSYVGQSDQCTA